MPKSKPDKRKPETIIRELKRELGYMERAADSNHADFKAARAEATTNALEIGRLQAELHDWKRRFDVLLDAIPELRNLGSADVEPQKVRE